MHATLPGRSGRGQDFDNHPHAKRDDMVFVADAPVLDVLWTMIIFSCCVLVDLLRSIARTA